jgi:hypothetical protein
MSLLHIHHILPSEGADMPNGSLLPSRHKPRQPPRVSLAEAGSMWQNFADATARGRDDWTTRTTPKTSAPRVAWRKAQAEANRVLGSSVPSVQVCASASKKHFSPRCSPSSSFASFLTTEEVADHQERTRPQNKGTSGTHLQK